MTNALSDEAVSARLAHLEGAEFPPAETVQTAEDVIEHARPGPTAEKAIRMLVPHVPDEALGELVRRYVIPTPYGSLEPCREKYAGRLAEHLTDRGVAVRQGDEWTVEWDGQRFTGPSLCGLALLVVWLEAVAG